MKQLKIKMFHVSQFKKYTKMKTKKETIYKIDNFIEYKLKELEKENFLTFVETEKTILISIFCQFPQLKKFRDLVEQINYYHDCKVVEQNTKNDFTVFEFKKIKRVVEIIKY